MNEYEAIQAKADQLATNAIAMLTPCFPSTNPPQWTHRRTSAKNGSITQIVLEAELLNSLFDRSQILERLNWTEFDEGAQSITVQGRADGANVVAEISWHETRPR